MIERPASIVKELVENAIDAGSTSVTVEIKDGGISFIRIRITDAESNRRSEKCISRHSTSKIETVEDLSHIASWGSEEALSKHCRSDKNRSDHQDEGCQSGTRYVIEGGKRGFPGRDRVHRMERHSLCISSFIMCLREGKFLKHSDDRSGTCPGSADASCTCHILRWHCSFLITDRRNYGLPGMES